MAIYDLDKNEEIDYIKINWIEYQIWDIPLDIENDILKISTFTKEEKLVKQWKKIMYRILKIRNKDVNIEDISIEKIKAFIIYLKNKIEKWQIS